MERLVESWEEYPGLEMCHQPWSRIVDVVGPDALHGYLVVGKSDFQNWTVSRGKGTEELMMLDASWDETKKPELGKWKVGALKFAAFYAVRVRDVRNLSRNEYLSDSREAVMLAMVRHLATDCYNPACGWACLLGLLD